MTPPINIGGDTVEAITIDGTSVGEVTVGGDVVFSTTPDAGLLHNYDFSADSATTSLVEDQKNGGDLDSGSITEFGTINGKQAGSFAESDSIAGDFDTTLSEPYDVYVVGRFDSLPKDNNIPIDGFAEFVHAVWAQDPGSGLVWSVFQGSEINSSTGADTNNHIFTTQLDGTDTHRVDQIEVVSGDAGTNDLSGLTVGDDHEARNNGADATIGQILVYDPTVSGYSVSDVESYLIDRWGL